MSAQMEMTVIRKSVNFTLIFFSLFTAPLMKGDDIMIFKKKKKEKREENKNSQELKKLYESNKKLLDKLLKEAS